MNDEEISLIADKLASILISKFEAKQQEMAEQMVDILFNTPIKSQGGYIEEMRGKTGRQLMDNLIKS